MLEAGFPNLNGNYIKTSDADSRYNCIAWAYGENNRWFWPKKGSYWPAGVTREETVKAFMELFASIRYENCDSHLFEPGYEKIAIYALDGVPTHAARQLNNGKWTSKLGSDIDIEHDTVECLEGPFYGNAVVFMKRGKSSH
ncbi:MAG: hypothetical protein FWG66_00070 [Spirochaetes bacterium]|nr:hypothetical protein [Spirochaetota bacterium]